MRATTSILASAMAAVVFAAPQPLPQDIDIDGVLAYAPAPTQAAPYAATEAAQVPTFVPAADAPEAVIPVTVAQRLNKRVSMPAPSSTTTCSQPQPTGSGPVTHPDTASAFLANSVYDGIAQSAITPDGYTLAFSDVQGATSQAGYLGYYTLTSYDTLTCAQYCGQANACYAFNIYIERDPSYNPSASCPNPPSTVNYKCTLWGSFVSDSTATNMGQYREQFEVAIAGSNGYNSLAPPPSQPGFTGPVELGGAINAPGNTYMTFKYNPGPFDASFCTQQCLQQNNYNIAHPPATGSPQLCEFVNA